MSSGNPEHPHQRKHAFDLGEYGAGYMTNSLSLGCDCKGSIHYLDAHFPTRAGSVRTIKNAIVHFAMALNNTGIYESESDRFRATELLDRSSTEGLVKVRF